MLSYCRYAGSEGESEGGGREARHQTADTQIAAVDHLCSQLDFATLQATSFTANLMSASIDA
jgi:hypothetical protein